MSDLGSMIALCDPEEFTVFREDEGEIIDGIRRRDNAPQQFQADGVFTNADSRTLMRLDENTRTREVLVGLTQCALRIANIGKGELADKIEIPSRCRTYQIHEVSPWPQGGFFEVICVRLGQ